MHSLRRLISRLAGLPPLRRPARAIGARIDAARLRLLATDRGMRGVERRWIAAGRTVPPPGPVKYWALRKAGREHGCRVLVETGTYLGDMLLANHRSFDRLISIELSEELWERAKVRLAHLENVTLLQGDSEDRLREAIATLSEPAVFWLDAHYSAGITAMGRTETPIGEEVRMIVGAPQLAGSVVLIDDARLFGQGDYPSVEEVTALIAPRRLEIADDILRFVV